MILQMTQFSKLCLVTMLSCLVCLTATPMVLAASVPPSINRVEPPNWWAGNKLNPVRVLLHGSHLAGAHVQADGIGIKTSNVHVSASGHYVFVDITIAPHATAGLRRLRVTTPGGATLAPFRISPALPTGGRWQGFSPDDVIYLIMPDRFSDGDLSNDQPAGTQGIFGRDNPHLYHGGDFQGVIAHLPYLKDLGITAIWITPVYQNTNHNTAGLGQAPSSDYHGYGAVNQYEIDPHLGNMASLRDLVNKAHALGLKVIQDQVANHVGPRNPWVTDPPTPTWFNGTLQNHRNNTYQIWTVMDPHAVPAERADTLGGWFADTLPDLNQNDPEVARYEIQNTLWWLGEAGFDGIREDTMPYVPLTFWHQWSAALKAQYPQMHTVGEVYNGDVALVSYFQGGRIGPSGVDTGIGSLFDYPLYYPLRRVFAQGNGFQDLINDEAHDWLFPQPNQLVTFLGNHDVKRFMSEEGATVAGLELAQTFLLTNRGIPCLYYGDEIGMTGVDDPDNRRDFPGGFPGNPQNAFTAAGRTPQQQAIWQHVRTLTHLRAQHAALRRGIQKSLLIADQQWAYARVYGSDVVIVALNNDVKSATMTIPATGVGIAQGVTLRDRLGTVYPVTVTNGAFTVTLPARSSAVLTK
jgi:glycosidase